MNPLKFSVTTLPLVLGLLGAWVTGCTSTTGANQTRQIPESVQGGPTGDQRAAMSAEGLTGTTASALTVAAADGTTIDLGAHYGRRPVYLKFWATWCTPCREQMPHFKSVYEKKGDDMAVIAVNMGFNDDARAVQAFAREHELRMPLAIDDGRLAEAFDVRVTPQHVLIDRDGRIAHIGHSADDELDRQIERLTGTVSAPAAGLRVQVFMSSWCEWYLADSRPTMARDCARVREAVTALYRTHKERAQWSAVFTRVWSGEAEMREYADTHGLPLPLTLDTSGELFRRHNIQHVPTVIVVDGQDTVLYRQEGYTGTLAQSLVALFQAGT